MDLEIGEDKKLARVLVFRLATVPPLCRLDCFL
jgi:hypothetical protein